MKGPRELTAHCAEMAVSCSLIPQLCDRDCNEKKQHCIGSSFVLLTVMRMGNDVNLTHSFFLWSINSDSLQCSSPLLPVPILSSVGRAPGSMHAYSQNGLYLVLCQPSATDRYVSKKFLILVSLNSRLHSLNMSSIIIWWELILLIQMLTTWLPWADAYSILPAR